jgi:hypothetical protein
MIMAMMEERETRDEVLIEVRAIKEKLARAMDFNIHRILEEAREKQKQSDRTILPPPTALR